MPFTLAYGKIYINATIGNKTALCEFDTGCGENTWPASLKIDGKIIGDGYTDSDLFGHTLKSSRLMLPCVRLGNYEALQIPGFAYQDTIKNGEADTIYRTPLLGNSLFDHIVVTIDYAKKELTLRGPEYDFRQQMRHPGDKVLPFTIVDREKDSNWGYLIVLGAVQGEPVSWCLDTGWNHYFVGLLRPFVEQKWPGNSQGTSPGISGTRDVVNTSLTTTQIPMGGIYSQGQVALTGVLPFTIGANNFISFNRQAAVIPPFTKADGVIGYSVLRNYRVTLDYPRKQVLLEPYGEDAVKVLAKDEVVTLKQGSGSTTLSLRKGDTLLRYVDGSFEIEADGVLVDATARQMAGNVSAQGVPPRPADPGFTWYYYNGIGWVQKPDTPAKGDGTDGKPGTGRRGE